MKRHLGSFAVLAGGVFMAVGPIGLAQSQKPAPGGTPRIVYRFGSHGQIGLTILHKNKHIQLTYSDTGETSSTVLKIDGRDVVFGAGQGQWQLRPTPLAKGDDGRERLGQRCRWESGKIKITQVVEILPSHTGQLDTCLIKYILENSDQRPREVGLRAMIDTQIADNDGNTFALAGRAVIKSAEWKDPTKVPDVVDVRERTDPKSPGFIAQLTVKVGGHLEPPNRLALTHWPGPSRVWEVPLEDILGDAAAVLYWRPRPLEAGGKRYLGYAYGQGVLNLDKASR